MIKYRYYLLPIKTREIMDHHPRKLILVLVLSSGIFAGLSSALVIADQATTDNPSKAIPQLYFYLCHCDRLVLLTV